MFMIMGEGRSMVHSFSLVDAQLNKPTWHKYHGYQQGKYLLPNDDIEQGREAIQYDGTQLVMGGALYHSPIGPSLRKVLDIGTGLGTWAIDMGDHFPEAKVLGLDLSPIQPSYVPSNVDFQVDDVELDWVIDSDWDFIHMRNVARFLKKPSEVLERAFQHLQPGGWVEMQDVSMDYYSDDGTLTDDCPIHEWFRLMHTIWPNYDIAKRGGQVMEDIGYVNVHSKAVGLPVGPWPKDPEQRTVGLRMATAFLVILETCSALLPQDQRPADIEVLSARIRETLRNNKIHKMTKICAWMGQKPLDG
ncbi:S-adenosyl-L-methionine-dependent methyltransferase [Pseudomassariella vexata]|uniref:S-adenosyl-L-methionine-dependent methyltransferase n=1 Tax=Pseudomassariella vexata TaxID=1141098 RepID=A0A1Y2DQ80_9PEZI|nr:S-adenosyl-L-methionine-dependent methyltransferase [Pseudomassariella vexata]ORY61339.1 S-adenosyl-L-methionine-dependent methyltransferase [Pseudomassariella vexata]